MTACDVSEEELWDLLDGSASDGMNGVLARHVKTCEVCGSRLDEMRRLDAGLATIGRMKAPSMPERIGPYKIVRLIGEGGMGLVYEAQQSSPARRVAIKVIRLAGASGGRRLRLFQREIRVLSRLRHASIARIYDVGHTPQGAPYFVMELITGRSLVEYCAQADLSLRDRLALFVQTCRAVHYAHQRGVMHRDLKPANILVDNDGVPHVLDFGLSRFTDPELNLTRTLSSGQSPLGTLPYMSPEQTRGDPDELDIRTDIYSLGVILYELLTGQYPYDVTGPPADVFRTIAETEPAPPGRVRPGIPGDVATIALKALAKEKDRRYASAANLVDDVERFLAGEAISARPPSTAYHVRVFARRNKAVCGAVATVFVVLVAGVLVSTSSYVKAETARAEAVQIAEALKKELASKQELANEMRDLGNSKQAEPLYWDVLETRRQLLGDEHPDVATTLSELGVALWSREAYADAEPLHRMALAMRRKLLGDEHVDVATSLYNLGLLLVDTERYAEAEPVLREALAIRRKLLGDEHEYTIRTAASLGGILRKAGELNEAEVEAMLRETLEGFRVALGEDHPSVGFARCRLGAYLTDLGRYDEAERELLEALRLLTAHYLTDDHPAVAPTFNPLATLYEAWGRPEEATQWLEELESIRRWRLETTLAERGAEDFDTGRPRGELGKCLTRMARYAEAEEQVLEAHRVLDAAVGDDHIRTIRAVRALVDLYEAWGKPAETADWRARLLEPADDAAPDS